MKGVIYMAITKDNIIGEVITEHPELIETFFQNGMMCIGCPASRVSPSGRRPRFTASTQTYW